MQRALKMIPPHRIPVISKSGDVLGNVGPKATSATAARFIGHQGARLAMFGGRQCWIEAGQNQRFSPPLQIESANKKAARGSVKAIEGRSK